MIRSVARSGLWEEGAMISYDRICDFGNVLSPISSDRGASGKGAKEV